MLEFVKKAFLAGAGLAMMTTEKIQELFNEMVKKGEITEKEARESVSELLERTKDYRQEAQDWLNRGVKSALQSLEVPTREEIEELRARLDRLEKSRGEE